MSFASDLYYIMSNDSSLNAAIDGGIYFENLPDNFDLTKKWILYYYRKTEQTDCIGIKNAFSNYEVTTVVIAPNSADVITISDLVTEKINGQNYGSIIDMNQISDGHSFDNEKNIYTNSLVFDSIHT